MTDTLARLTVLAALAGLGAFLALPVGPAAAQQRMFSPPQGCTAFLTVQSRGCTVSHHWTCEADPDGTHWRIALDTEGPFYLSMSDPEFRWLLSYDLRTGGSSTLIEPEEDPASLSELLETGRDSMVFSLIREDAAGQRTQRDYTGFDALTGETVDVDGRSLLRTQFSYQYATGTGVRRVSGNQYVHRGWRLFFGGEEVTRTADGAEFESDSSPMEFAEPGERGFLTLDPIYDCGDMMSALPLQPGNRG